MFVDLYDVRNDQPDEMFVDLHLVDFGEKHGAAKTICGMATNMVLVPEGADRHRKRCPDCERIGSTLPIDVEPLPSHAVRKART